MSTSTKYNIPIVYNTNRTCCVQLGANITTSVYQQPSSHTPLFGSGSEAGYALSHSNFCFDNVSILQRFTSFTALDNSPDISDSTYSVHDTSINNNECNGGDSRSQGTHQGSRGQSQIPQAQQLTSFTALDSISDDPNPDSVHDISTNVCGNDNGFHRSDGPFQQPFNPFIMIDYSSPQYSVCGCFSATREYILEIIQRWIDNPCTTHIIWMYGPTSARGSAIAQKVADANERDKVAATFFFRSDSSCNDGNRLFTTLAWQLANSIPAIKYHISHSLNECPDLPIRDVETQFEGLIFRPFLALNAQQAPIVIIDSIDECLDEKLQQRILNIIGNAVKNPDFPLRFLISSRFNIHIEETFSRFQSPILRADLMDAYDADRAVADYLRDKFARIAAKKGLEPTWPGQKIVQHLVNRCSGQLLYPSVVIGLVSDEDNDAETQLNIITGLKSRHTTSPYPELDELYLEILKRVLDQDFLKAFLALLVGRSLISIDDLSNDDAMLMDISPVQLENRIREMRSIVKREPDVDVYNPFLEFLQDSSRAAQYHISRSVGTKRYLGLITKSLIERAARLTSQPDFHSIDHFTPEFSRLIKRNPQAIELDIKDWEQILGPLLNVLDKLLKLSNIDRLKDGYCRQCQFFQIAYDILIHLKSIQIKEDPVVKRCLRSLEEIIRYPRRRKPMSKLDRVFSGLGAKQK